MTTPSSPEPRKRSLRTILIVVGAVLVVCCGGAVTGGFLLFKGISVATGPARAATNAFLDDVEAGDTSGAYASLCSSVRAEFTLAEFQDVVESHPRLQDHSITNVSVSNSNGVVTGSVTARLTYAGGASESHTVELISTDGTWQVCGDPY